MNELASGDIYLMVWGAATGEGAVASTARTPRGGYVNGLAPREETCHFP